jgi:hypothetical protein
VIANRDCVVDPFVMAGLVPVTHVLRRYEQDVDARPEGRA